MVSASDLEFKAYRPVESSKVLNGGKPGGVDPEQGVDVVLVMGPGYDALALGGRQLVRIF